MFWHYLLVSWRNILRNKLFTIILVVGLAVGIASSLLLGIYTWNELTYDNFHEKKERIFLVGVRQKEGENESEDGWTSPPLNPIPLNTLSLTGIIAKSTKLSRS